jgi:DNA-binding beta-propeller fold protein YncE
MSGFRTARAGLVAALAAAAVTRGQTVAWRDSAGQAYAATQNAGAFDNGNISGRSHSGAITRGTAGTVGDHCANHPSTSKEIRKRHERRGLIHGPISNPGKELRWVAREERVGEASPTFVNWETSHVHPLDMTPDGTRLLAINTPDNRLEVFDLTGGLLSPVASIPVGLEPVSVRVRSDHEAWVVNQISDSVSVVNLDTLNVVATLRTVNEPADVVFAGAPQRAFVSCSQARQVLVFDPENLSIGPTVIPIDAETPRAMAVSPSRDKVYVAMFASGNASTMLGGRPGEGFPPNAVSHPGGPYGGVNPPPNAGNGFEPPLNPANPSPPLVGLIVKKAADGAWRDDNGTDWTDFVSGPRALQSGRPVGWDLPDRDLAVIDTATLQVGYASGLMNIGMSLATNPASGELTVVGTDATNEVRFEPNVASTFVRVNMARVDPSGTTRLAVVDLNPHLDYATLSVPQSERDKSIGDPRGIVWNQTGSRGYVSGMGSNNVIVIEGSGARAGLAPTIAVGEGPTGVVLDEARQRLYVLNKFDASVSAVNTQSELEVERAKFFDPTPQAIKIGRKHLYDTHRTSGLGQASCASCHVDARMDRLAWDLGNPAGDMRSDDHQNLGLFNPLMMEAHFGDFHPMKGPMMTQTLQDIIGKEPLHWRGDRDGLEEFNPTFVGLLGSDAMLTESEMQEFKDFLATLHFPPNPFRNLDNTLPTDLPLPGHYSGGRFTPSGTPLPNGNALNGLNIFRFPRITFRDLSCDGCHTLPVGVGTNQKMASTTTLVDIPSGPHGEKHHGLMGALDVNNPRSMKIPQARNLFEKVGFEATQSSSRAGFGFMHDGAVDSLARFVSGPGVGVNSDQEVADLVAFLLSFSGSDLPPAQGHAFEPVGPSGQDAHAAVGLQTTVADSADPPPGQTELISQMLGFAEGGVVGLVAKGVQDGLQRGYVYSGGQRFDSDLSLETLTESQLLALAKTGGELTLTVVAKGTERRIGIDRDLDGAPDRDEIAACSAPTDPASLPGARLDISGGPIVSGDSHTFTLSCALPGRTLYIWFSLDGLGITITPEGELGIENAELLGELVPDVSGVGTFQFPVADSFAGLTVWWQAIDQLGNVTDIESAVVQ